MRQSRFRDSFALGTVPLFGVWMLWTVSPPLPFTHHGSTVPAREAVARVEATSRRHSSSARALYETRCVRCHEPDGKASELHESIPHAPDFTDPHWHQNRSTTQLIVSILDGKGTQMPAFGGKLSSAEARDLVAYLRTFAPSSPTGSEASPDDFETRFRELEEEFQRLKEQLDELSPRRKR
jgi:mono/diheme cytochrome c family protein